MAQRVKPYSIKLHLKPISLLLLILLNLALLKTFRWHWLTLIAVYSTAFAGCIVIVESCLNWIQIRLDNAERLQQWLPTLDADMLRPKLFVSSTSHHRFASKTKFRYPILCAGFASSFRGSVGSIFAVKQAKNDAQNGESKAGLAWFTVDPAEYSNPNEPFDRKFQPFLRRNDIDPISVPHMYVVTIPKFCGWGWCPVSCYFFYTCKHYLSYTIIEVNNTFGERHLYLMRRSASGTSEQSTAYTYSTDVTKAFHISPFQKGTGSYVFSVKDPLTVEDIGFHAAAFDEMGRRTFVASCESTNGGIDVIRASMFRLLYIVMAWGPTAAFLGIPRTYFQAIKTKRSKLVKLYARPEVENDASGGRSPTSLECECQAYFHRFLLHQVGTTHLNVEIHVQDPKSDPVFPANVHHLSSKRDHASFQRQLSLVIKNAAFFAHFLSSSQQSDQYFSWLEARATEFRMATYTDKQFLSELLFSRSPRARKNEWASECVFKWILLSMRFCFHTFTVLNNVLKQQPVLSQMDLFAIDTFACAEQFAYMRLLLKVMLFELKNEVVDVLFCIPVYLGLAWYG